jgi:hypothetical protein
MLKIIIDFYKKLYNTKQSDLIVYKKVLKSLKEKVALKDA